jgi:hypothetical protein
MRTGRLDHRLAGGPVPTGTGGNGIRPEQALYCFLVAMWEADRVTGMSQASILLAPRRSQSAESSSIPGEAYRSPLGFTRSPAATHGISPLNEPAGARSGGTSLFLSLPYGVRRARRAHRSGPAGHSADQPMSLAAADDPFTGSTLSFAGSGTDHGGAVGAEHPTDGSFWTHGSRVLGVPGVSPPEKVWGLTHPRVTPPPAIESTPL